MEFEAHYANLYASRWRALRCALLADPQYRVAGSGSTPYYLDPASVLAAEALGVRPGDQVLDMCAGPGGKCLVLATALDSKGSLVANERSASRRHRLKRVLDENLTAQQRAVCQITPFDANQFGLRKKERFDRVLLDAPCSSERHLLRQGNAAEWSVRRSQGLAIQQYSLLCAAVQTCKPGGSILYSTCSLSPLENDDVIQRLIQRKWRKHVQVQQLSFEQGEKTKYGWIFLPDETGWGVLYLSLIRRRPT